MENTHENDEEMVEGESDNENFLNEDDEEYKPEEERASLKRTREETEGENEDEFKAKRARLEETEGVEEVEEVEEVEDVEELDDGVEGVNEEVEAGEGDGVEGEDEKKKKTKPRKTKKLTKDELTKQEKQILSDFRQITGRGGAKIKSSESREERKIKDKKDTKDDVILEDFVERMQQAYKDDNIANEKKDPALYKLQMLPEVVALLQKQRMKSKPDPMVLKAVRLWLSPMPDNSLPNLKIRESLLKALDKIDMKEPALLGSGIGKAINYLSQSKSESPQNQRLCKEMLLKWTRSLLSISANYKDIVSMDYEEYTEKKPKTKTKTKTRSKSLSSLESVLDSQSSTTPTKVNLFPAKASLDVKRVPTASPKSYTETKLTPKSEKKVNRLQEKLQSKPKNNKPRAFSVGINRSTKT